MRPQYGGGPLVQIVGLINEYQEAALSVRMLVGVMNQKPERGTHARPARVTRLAGD